jgi:hypothetical protein
MAKHNLIQDEKAISREQLADLLNEDLSGSFTKTPARASLKPRPGGCGPSPST